MILRRHRRVHHIHGELPDGVRILAWTRSVRWIGWGLGEALLPVFIFLFANSFAETGLLSATVDITALASLPFIGIWADRFPAKRLILVSLLLYPLVGLGYLLAGVSGLAIFIVLARAVNGLTWEMENVGIVTYYRRTVDKVRIATSFGYLDTWTHVAWIAAALLGMLLVYYLPVHYLLFAIAPFALIAYGVARRVPEDALSPNPTSKTPSLRSYAKALREWRTWNAHLWLLGALVLFSSIISTLMYFFLPIDAYLAGANLPMVVLVTVFGAIPALFGYQLGHIADRRNKYALLGFGLVGVAVIALGLAVFPYYWFKLVAIFLMGIILELFFVVQNSLITALGPSETYGERGSAFEGIITLGDLAAPLLLGIGLDVIGFGHLALIVAGGALLLSFGYHMIKFPKIS